MRQTVCIAWFSDVHMRFSVLTSCKMNMETYHISDHCLIRKEDPFQFWPRCAFTEVMVKFYRWCNGVCYRLWLARWPLCKFLVLVSDLFLDIRFRVNVFLWTGVCCVTVRYNSSVENYGSFVKSWDIYPGENSCCQREQLLPEFDIKHVKCRSGSHTCTCDLLDWLRARWIWRRIRQRPLSHQEVNPLRLCRDLRSMNMWHLA